MDRSVQGVLVGRVILYWVCALLYVGLGSACFQYNQNPDWTLAKHAQVLFGQVWPWLPTAIILLPLAIYDVVRLSNLFAGPVCRLRKHFAALREDIACAPLVFREEDYWRDLAAPINDMQAEILRLRTGIIELQKAASAPTIPSSVNDVDAETPTEDSALVQEPTASSTAEPIQANAEAAAETPAEIADVAIAPLPPTDAADATTVVPLG
ncbi:MAG: hypothetical protein SFV81_18105 [Pirellulaceae bacterium]|nr:hypothetical protein [Pirellulaceae bacterium]